MCVSSPCENRRKKSTADFVKRKQHKPIAGNDYHGRVAPTKLINIIFHTLQCSELTPLEKMPGVQPIGVGGVLRIFLKVSATN